MDFIQMDLFAFATTTQSIKTDPILRNFVNGGKYPLPITTAKRITANLDAIRILKTADLKNLTEEQKITLSQFSGWGGLTEIFMEENSRYLELKDLLTSEEYETAAASMLDSYYTPANLIRFMWDLAQNEFGIKSGKVAELGCGTGNFIGYAPNQAKYQFFGVEVDKISGSIAKALYPKADIRIQSLEKVMLPTNIDLVIGNVPFGQTAPYDPKYKLHTHWNLHNYFIAKALDTLKPNGHAIILTSNSTMDQPGSMSQFLTEAGLVKAFRLPKNSFAGTEIVADILVFEKGYHDQISGNLQYVETGDNTGRMEINRYFAEHPEQVWGTLSNTGKMYGKLNTPTVLPDEKSLDEHIAEYQHPESKVIEPEILPEPVPAAEVAVNLFGEPCVTKEIPDTLPSGELPEGICRQYSLFTKDGEIYQLIGTEGVRLKDSKGNFITGKEADKVRSFIRIKETLKRLIAKQLDEFAEDDLIEDFRHELNQLYHEHVAKYGVISNKTVHKNCVEDPEYLKVSAIETCRKVTETNKAGIKITKKIYEPGDILTKRTQWPWHEPDHIDDVLEAGLISHAYRNLIDIPYITRITGKSEDEVRTELLQSGEYFYNPANLQIELKSKYLSGNIQAKIREAESFGLTANVAALQEVLPKPLTIEDIDFSLGAFWLPGELVKKWVQKDLSATVEVSYDAEQDTWVVKTDYQNRELLNQYNVENMDTVTLLEQILNLKDPIIKNRVWNPVRSDYDEIVNKEATLTARQYKNEIMNRFHDFIMDDPELSQEVERVYNGLFNNHVLQQYDVPKFDIYPGAASVIDGKEFRLRDHQKRAVSRCIQGNTLLAHAVGAGKTAVMITAAMELIRLKLATKTMIVVQNATLQQFAEFAPKLYPTADILIATKNDLVKDKRKRFLGRIATGKWDIIIIAQSSFNMIEDNPDIIRAKYMEELEQLKKVSEARKVSGGTSRRQRKAEEKSRRGLQRKIDKLGDRHALENIVYFDELGIDALFVDEAHEYKRNLFVTKMNRVKGLDNGASQKAFSLTLKIDHIREKTGGRNIYFATGTPVTNCLTELWQMVRYVSPETLKDFNVDTFDRFASTFTQTETALEIDAAGRFKMVTRFCKFTNIVELSKMFRSCADVILSEDLKDIPRPPIKGGHPEQVRIPRSDIISDFMDYLCDTYIWFEQLPGDEKRDWTHIPICIYTLSRKSTLDMRMIAADAPDDPNSKLNVCVQKVIEKYHFYESIKGTQIIFSDLHQLTVDGIVEFDVFKEIKRKLVEAGIPENEIAIVNEYKTDKQRQDAFDLVNRGEIRIIMGSTRKLGTGVNIQERLAVAHHLDAPFRPADMEQRDGRIIRQGNILPEVEIIRYGMEQTLDAGMYQILTRKQKFINDGLMGRRRNLAEINDTSIDYATFSADISGNPLMMRKVEIETRLREIQSLEYQFRRSIRRNSDLTEDLRRSIPKMEDDIKVMREFAARPYSTEFPEIELNGRVLEGTTEYKIKQLANVLLNKGLYEAVREAKSKFATSMIDLGFAKINGTEIELTAYCPVEEWRTREDKACIRYKLAGVMYHNVKIKTGSEVTTGTGLISSLKTLLENQADFADEEERHLKVCKARLAQLQANAGHETFKHADERNSLQKELDAILFELNSKDMLHEDRVIDSKPSLCDYIDLGVEVIADKIENITEAEPESADAEADDMRKSA